MNLLSATWTVIVQLSFHYIGKLRLIWCVIENVFLFTKISIRE